MDLIIKYSLLLLSMALSAGCILFVKKRYSAIAVFFYLLSVIIGGALITGQLYVIVFGVAYVSVVTWCFYHWNLPMCVGNLRISVPLGIMFGTFISGAVYFVFESIQKVAPIEVLGGSELYFLEVFALLLLLLVLTFGIWGITHRRPAYLDLFSRREELLFDEKEGQ